MEIQNRDWDTNGSATKAMKAKNRQTFTYWMAFVSSIVLGASAVASEYFVAVDGCDEGNDGLSRQAAFASIQRGVDALQPGDTLTVLPGEYFGPVYREELGGEDVRTVIRAEIPGTAVVRGDRPLANFRLLDGYRFIYVTDVDFAESIQTVNELDTLTIIEDLPTLAPLEFTPGRFFHDVEAGKVYLSTADLASPVGRLYTASITGSQGIHLVNPLNVTIEGLAVTGFNRNELAPRSEASMYSTWGILIVNGRNCIIRNCTAWLNGRGMMLNSRSEGSGHNVIEHCTAWANTSQYGSGDFGGLTIHNGRADVIRDSVAFRNARYGMNIRSEADGSPPQDAEGNYIFNYDNHSRMIGNLAWGNSSADFKIKTGHPYIHTVESCVSPGLWSVRPDNVSDSLVGMRSRDYSPDNINLSDYDDLDVLAEFADPINFDYRLQSTSRFRGTGEGGADRGPFPYQTNIYYVCPGGSDAADGLSVSTAWHTLARALPALRAGDTLYVQGGVYAVDLDWHTGSHSDDAIAVLGRGDDEVVIRGRLSVSGSVPVEFGRLQFTDEVTISGSPGARMENCSWAGGGLKGIGLASLSVRNCLFADASITLESTENVHLAGNVFTSTAAPAVVVDAQTAIRYSDYNCYANADETWMVAGKPRAFDELGERYSRLEAVVVKRGDDGRLLSPQTASIAAAGPLGTAMGLHDFKVEDDDSVRVVGPWIHSITDTTVNIEWGTSAPTHNPETTSAQAPSVRLDWGTAPEMEHSTLRQTNRFGDFSLSGLEPDTEYFLRLTFFRPIRHRPVAAESAVVDSGPEFITLRFRTAAAPPPARDLFVAPDGDNRDDGLSRETAWRTLNHAADQVRPGDTVHVAGGTYSEAVRVRATGELYRPITFRAQAGEKVIIDGVGRTLDYAFFAADKSHLRFDGFYFVNMGYHSDSLPWSDLSRGSNGAFVLYESHDVHITRCFLDGRGPGSSPGLAHARHCADLLIENNVMLNCMGRLEIYWNSPRTRIRHNVFLRNFITHVSPHIRGNRINNDDDLCHFTNNIVTDNLLTKSHAGLAISAENRDNGFYLRFPAAERAWHSGAGTTFADMLAGLDEGDRTIVANPQFAGALEMEQLNDDGTPVFLAERLLRKPDLDFPDLFATNPDYVDHEIGLQREAFEDFHFNRGAGEE